MLLSQNQILEHMKNGKIVIDPFNDRNLKTTSYDVTLGPWFWREKAPKGRHTIHNLYDEQSTKTVWSGPFEAGVAGGQGKDWGIEIKKIRTGGRTILR